MAKDMEEVRIEAVRRYLSGEDATSITKELGVTRQWFYKWAKRYREGGGDTWFKEKSKAPHHLPRKTNPEIEHLVLEVRERLESMKYSQIGASAIAWELKKLGVSPIPYPWTINRILFRHGKVTRREKYKPKGTPYPYFPG
ncbi:MAG: leucine zipper domain-containing protein, partial [Actinomycetota bacterium]|nr:leucine zipper domain-containing protein [Actinomycetota bacterium]